MRLENCSVGERVYLRRDGAWEAFCVVHQGSPGSGYGGFSGGIVLMKAQKIDRELVANPAGSKGTYLSSKIHEYLNEDFLNSLDPDIAQIVMAVEIPYRSGTEISDRKVGTMTAKVWLPSLTEITNTVQEYNNSTTPSYTIPYVTEGSRFSYWAGADYDQYYSWAVLGDKLYGGDYEDLGWSTRTPNEYVTGDFRCLFYKIGCAGYGEVSYQNRMAVYPCLVLPGDLIVDSNGHIRAKGGAANISVKIDGVWKPGNGLWCKCGGVWSMGVSRKVKVGGVWKE